ncbi:MAG: hypothetical protein JXK07_09705 [Spirochaetes bacterium]|nr:hypothetical protein [Spirochaetota bacterium]MBN2769446.1 hypothetical protein [Spirochaetota bacterium]
MKYLFSCFCISLLITSCALSWEDESDSPVNSFDYFWKEMKYYYPGFISSGLDWNSVYAAYKPLIKDDPTNENLRKILIEITDMINDEHMRIYFSKSSIYPDLPNSDEIFMHSIISNYAVFENSLHEEMYSYGFINDDIGYMWIKRFYGEGMSASAWAKDAAKKIKSFELCKALIIDVRNNDGGNLLNAEEILKYFITENIMNYSTQYWKTGPGYNDYQHNKSGSINKADYTFNKPVILLMNKGSVSTTDVLGVLMKHNDLALLVGESNTISIIGDTYPVELPNGWLVQFGRFAHELYDGLYSEGDILQMDHEVINTTDELEQGIDRQLEYAIQLVDSM